MNILYTDLLQLDCTHSDKVAFTLTSHLKIMVDIKVDGRQDELKKDVRHLQCPHFAVLRALMHIANTSPAQVKPHLGNTDIAFHNHDIFLLKLPQRSPQL